MNIRSKTAAKPGRRRNKGRQNGVVMALLLPIAGAMAMVGCRAITIDVPTTNDLHESYLELIGKISQYSSQIQTLEGEVSSYVPGADAAGKKAEFETTRSGISENVNKLSADYATLAKGRLEGEIELLKSRLETLKGTIDGIVVAREIAIRQILLAAINGSAVSTRGA